MKKLALTLIFILAIGGLYAQKGWYVGLRVVPQSTWILNQQDSDAGEQYFSYVKTYGVASGVGGGYAFNNHIGVFADLLYSSQGQAHSYEATVDGKTRTFTDEVRLRYLKLPVMFRLTTNTERKTAFVFQFGPQIDYLVSVKQFIGNTAYPHTNQLPIDPPGQPDFYNVPDRYYTFKSLVFDGVVGLGAEVKLRYNLKMHLLFRADYSLTDIENKDATFDVYQNGNIETVKFYESQYVYPHYTGNRPPSNNLTGGLLIGFSYVLIPKFHY